MTSFQIIVLRLFQFVRTAYETACEMEEDSTIEPVYADRATRLYMAAWEAFVKEVGEVYAREAWDHYQRGLTHSSLYYSDCYPH